MSLIHRLWFWFSTSLQSAFGYAVRISGSPPISDEVQLTSFLLQTSELSQKIKAFGIDPAVMLTAVARCEPAERGSIKSVLKVVHGTRYMMTQEGQSNTRTPLNLFTSQIQRGSPAIRAALEEAGVDVRSLMFYFAHSVHEANCPITPHDHRESKYGIEILNDDFTPMEFVVDILLRYFGMEKSEAVKVMLQIHFKGSAVLPQASIAQATHLATAVNADARQHYFPLLLKVVTQPALAADAP